MKNLPRGLKPWLICTAIGLAIHTISSWLLFPVDLIQALQLRAQAPLLSLTFLILARIFLYFVAPGWGLYLLARILIEQRMNSRAKS